MTPLLRLAGLIAFAILVVVLLVFWISSCQGASKKSAYKHYMEKVAVVAKDSEQIGRELNDALTTQGIKFSDLKRSSTGLAQQEQQDVAAAARDEPARAAAHPAPARDRGARVPGQRPARPRRRVPDSVAVAEERDRQRPAPRRPGRAARLRRRRLGRPVQGSGDRGAAPPGDHRRRRARLELRPEPRLREHAVLGGDPPAAPGRHRRRAARPAACTARCSSRRRRCPSNQELSADDRDTVTATTDLGFAVTIEDSGDSQEVQVKVTLTIQQAPSPIVQTQDGRPDQPGRAEDGHVPEPRPGAVRDADDREGGHPAGAGREEHRQQLRAVPGHLLARVMGLAGWIAVGAAAVAAVAVWSPRPRLLASCGRAPGPGGAARRGREGGRGRLRRLAPGADRRPAPCGGRGRGCARPRRPARRRLAVAPALVRYDAYEDTGGHQSASVALLDSARSGIVLTAIQGRDYARVYVKQLDHGRTPIALSPEETRRSSARCRLASRRRRARPAVPRRPERLRFGGLGQVLVLNASYEPLNVCSVRRAHVLVFKGKAEVLEKHEHPAPLRDRHASRART